MQKEFLLLTLSLFTTLTTLNGQELKDGSVFNTLTFQVISLPELQNYLLTDACEGKNAIFIQTDITTSGINEVFSQNTTPPYYIWNAESLFFYAIDYWIKPTLVTVNENSAKYEFETCSYKKLPRKYFEGEIVFKYENGLWNITEKKIREINSPSCIGYD